MEFKLQKLRKLNRYSQQAIADILGISQANYWKIETGKVRLTVENALKLVDTYGLEKIEDLVEER